MLAVFFNGFRPWDGPLLEDWGIAADWRASHTAVLGNFISVEAGRPLHLIGPFIGVFITDGGINGMYLVSGLVAVATSLLIVAALIRIGVTSLPAWLIGITAGLHPWWPAGDILRFLPADVSVMWFALWMFLAVTYLKSGRRALIPLMGVPVLLAMLPMKRWRSTSCLPRQRSRS